MEKEEVSERICIDTQMITHAILNEYFKNLLIENIGIDFPYTTELCKKETIGNLKFKLNISWGEAKNRFSLFEKEIGLKYLEFKPEYYHEGNKMYDKIISLDMRVKNKITFLKDCANICVIMKNKINVFFCNDEELEKACKKLNYNLEFIRIPVDSQKIIKDTFKEIKSQYRKNHQKARK